MIKSLSKKSLTDKNTGSPENLADQLIIIARECWGNTDFIEFSRHAMARGVKVYFIGYPPTRPIDILPVIRSPREGGGLLDFTREAGNICRDILRESPFKITAIHVRYYKTCSLLPMIIKKSVMLDFRSGSIRPSSIIRVIEHVLMRLEAHAFGRVTVISRRVGHVIGLKNFYVIPLGASSQLLEIPRQRVPDPCSLRFIYVGTLRQRNINLFASAFSDFVENNNLNWRLDIYGYGADEDINSLDDITKSCNKVKFHGLLARGDIFSKLSEADIGVSFIPMTSYFEWQPPTKTFEYLMAGLPVLATKTSANVEVLGDEFGWLCNDTQDSIRECLLAIQHDEGKRNIRREKFYEYTWSEIFNRHYCLKVLMRKLWF